jgi:hypothetical protein
LKPGAGSGRVRHVAIAAEMAIAAAKCLVAALAGGAAMFTNDARTRHGDGDLDRDGSLRSPSVGTV